MMKSEEVLLKEKYGQRCPFKVPEGYFEDFASRMMTMLPEREQGARVVALHETRSKTRPLWTKIAAAAACFCGLVCGTVALMNLEQTLTAPAASEDAEYSQSVSPTVSAVDYMADYAMMDNTDIYAYVSSN